MNVRSTTALSLPFWKMANRSSFAAAKNGSALGAIPLPASARPAQAKPAPVAQPAVQVASDSTTKSNEGRLGPMSNEDTLKALKEAFGTFKGDKKFREDLDFDHDGEISVGDYAILSQKSAPPKEPDEFDLLRSSFGKFKGEQGYLEKVDYNQDGVVDVGDYSILSQRVATEAQKAKDLAAFKAAYGSFEGDKNFNKSYDLDGDGEINIGDYSLLSAKYA